MAKLVSQVYGEALFGLALEKNCLAQYEEELSGVAQVLKEYPEYQAILEHPQLDENEKIQVFDNVFAGRICDEICGFFHILLEKGRFSHLEAIRAYFADRKREHEKTGVAYVTSAVELSAAQKDRIREKLLSTTDYVSMQVNYTTDADLIGGLLIRIGDRVVDSSIRTRLEDMKRNLMKVQL